MGVILPGDEIRPELAELETEVFCREEEKTSTPTEGTREKPLIRKSSRASKPVDRYGSSMD